MAPVIRELAINWDQLLAPIAPDDPCGVDLRYEPVYDHIRDLRRQEDPNVPQGVWQRERKQADWAAVASECLRVLETQSKDLQIAAWLLEAWLNLHGFQGAAEGFRVIHALCDRFWDDLHPRIQDGDTEFRIGPILWLNDRIPVALKLIPLTVPDSTDIRSYAFVDWEKASQAETQRAADGRPKAAPVTFAQLQQSAMLTASSCLLSTLGAVQRLLQHCVELDRLLDGKMGREAPCLAPVRAVGEAVANLITKLVRERGGDARDQQQNAAPILQGTADILELRSALMDAQPDTSPDGQPFSDCVAGRISTRAHAYQLLRDAADFLARTEPHSPAPYLIRRAISWGTKSFEELLPELVRNQAELVEIYRLLDVGATNTTKK